MVINPLFDKNRRALVREAIRRNDFGLLKRADAPAIEPARQAAPEPLFDENTRIVQVPALAIPPVPNLSYRAGRLNSPDYVPLSALDHQLLQAAYRNDVASAEDALRKGANPDIRDSASVAATIMFGEAHSRSWGDTPLMIAARSGSLDIVRLLISFRANVNLDYGYGSCPMPTALSYAREGKQMQIELELLDAGATR